MSNWTVGLSGLQNTSLAIDTTSNNIANANTVGYKAGDYVFADQYFKAVNPSDVNRVGLGSERLAVRRPLTYGTINNSSNPLDMAIGGDGWFRVLTNPSDPTSLNYTRNGQFAVDKNGWIVNENGMYLTGFQPTADGTGLTDDTRGPGTTNGKLKMPPAFANGTQTKTSTISAVLDSRENAYVKSSGVAFDPAQSTYNDKTTQTIFDSNGTSHTLDVYYRRITDSALQITSTSKGGYTYSPGPTASPNTSQTTNVVMPMTSALTVVTPASNTLQGATTGTPSLGTGSLSLSGAQTLTSNLNIGDHVYVNGIDSGLTVAAGYPTGTSLSNVAVTGSAVQIPANASFTFYPADIALAQVTPSVTATLGTAIASGQSSLTGLTASAGSAAISTIAQGQRVFVNGVDTGVVVTANSSGNLTLSGSLPVGVNLTDTLSFAAPSGPTTTVSVSATASGVSTLTVASGSNIVSGQVFYLNGVNTGLTVTGVSGTTVTLSGLLTSSQSTAISTAHGLTPPADLVAAFSPPLKLASAVTTAGQTSLQIATGSNDTSAIVGTRVFIGGQDTGVTVTSVTAGGSNDTINLSGPLPSTYASGAVLSFKQNLNMQLTAPDGTAIAVTGTTNKQNSGTILNAAKSNIEVYAAIDGVFYNPTNTNNGLPHSNFTNFSAETSGAGGYQPIALIGEVAGRNIDSLVTDSASGKPLFSTKITLSSQVANGTSQTDTIPLIYNLDLSGTQLQASSFQVNQSVQDGEPRSQLSSVTIDSSGAIVGVYGNGRKLYAGQIALAHFDASEQLIPTGGNSFAPSYTSGSEGDNGVIVGKPGDGSFGAIKSQAVEQSNVDLSNELVKLMILQRMYSADSQSIRAFDQTMRDTIQMTG